VTLLSKREVTYKKDAQEIHQLDHVFLLANEIWTQHNIRNTPDQKILKNLDFLLTGKSKRKYIELSIQT
jgi:hypothetical protein